MAYLTSKQLLLSLMIVFLMFSMKSDARYLRKELDSRLLLLEMGYTESKLEYHRRITEQTPGAIDRVSPGGPDPEHHSHSPGKQT
ncbi:CLAVATA3/ESR-RELATED 5 [Euphorbia peplus]|nr:CLAVATA3/ESR-RELATED 5 [Euphorbia peplus]